ncbi:transcriptional activator FtrA [Phaeobacter sp. CECT 5382]|uniref:helix-turn-helix domain-containing protein n=1 Tax=Phaeobacter sp. CECT 5382 TaxID=1712645 RepID=UPI0006DAF1AB|nr:AraC family transcriptional regulator [Phaeobacter sp. CECT 5382]CUH89217.1 transcriptional activator FtrA [Phaeobacter sp. CECT 5382]
MDMNYILDEMEIRVDPFALCELNGACDLGLEKDSAATLHYVLAGAGELVISGRPPVPVSRGSLILVPALNTHVLRSFGAVGDPLPTCNPERLNLAHLIHQSQGETQGKLVAICARVRLTIRQMQNLVDLIRAPVVENRTGDQVLAAPIEQLLYELSRPRHGSRAMIRALLMQCMIELIRRRVGVMDGGLAWMAALRDQRMWPALQQMLDSPEAPHSVESLAALCGMSRSSFAQKFHTAYGSGPMELLRDLRMRRAAELLHSSTQPIERVAAQVGFRSRSAFSRAFEATTGLSPQRFRSQNPR